MKKVSPLIVGVALIAVAMGTKLFEVSESIGAQIEPVMVMKDVSVTAVAADEENVSSEVIDPVTVQSDDKAAPTASDADGNGSSDQVRNIEIDGSPPIEVVGVAEPQRVDELEKRERAVAEKEELLNLEIKMKLEEIKVVRDELIVIRNEILGKQDESIKRLSTMYGNMKAKDAAAILNKMPVDMVIKIIDGMSDVQASTILGAIDPKVATQITAIMIKRGERLK